MVAAREQRVERGLLQRRADHRAHLRALLDDVEAADARGARRRWQQRRQHQHRRRLAGAVRPEKPVDLAGSDARDRSRRPHAAPCGTRGPAARPRSRCRAPSAASLLTWCGLGIEPRQARRVHVCRAGNARNCAARRVAGARAGKADVQRAAVAGARRRAHRPPPARTRAVTSSTSAAAGASCSSVSSPPTPRRRARASTPTGRASTVRAAQPPRAASTTGSSSSRRDLTTFDDRGDLVLCVGAAHALG